MAPLSSNLDPHMLEKTLIRMFSPEWLRDTAKRVKYVQRERKVDPFILFWILVIGFGAGAQRSLAALRRAYEKESSEKIVASAFYDRFTEGLYKFLKECLAHGVADLARGASLTLSEKLRGFKDLVVFDGSIIKLHDMLADKFPGSRHKAELKICLTIGLTGNTKSVGIFSGNTPELKTIRIGSWVDGQIVPGQNPFFKAFDCKSVAKAVGCQGGRFS